MGNEPVEYTVVESLSRQWLKLPQLVMQEVGPAAQTLHALLMETSSKQPTTFTNHKKLRLRAMVPLKTFRNHLETLEEAGFITNLGRQPTRAGRKRKTNTYKVLPKARCPGFYGFLPWWACTYFKIRGRKGQFRLRWSERAVLSIILAKLATLKSAAEVHNPDDPEMVASQIYDWEDEHERWQFSLRALEERTGLERKAIIKAKSRLHWMGIIQWRTLNPAPCGDHSDTDALIINTGLRIRVTPAEPGFCHVELDTLTQPPE